MVVVLVSVLALYSDDPISNRDEANNYSVESFLKRKKIDIKGSRLGHLYFKN